MTSRNKIIINHFCWKKTWLFCAFLYFLFNMNFVFAQTATEELIRILNNIKTMQADFRQVDETTSAKKAKREILGRMIVERPGKFCWEIMRPSKQLIIVNDGKSLFYDADLEQVTKSKFNNAMLGNPAVLLSGNNEMLKKTFQVNLLKKEGSEIYFELQPKQKADSSDYQSIKIYFTNSQLKAMTITSDFGKRVNIFFSNMKTNKKVSPKVFEFTSPANVDVLESG